MTISEDSRSQSSYPRRFTNCASAGLVPEWPRTSIDSKRSLLKLREKLIATSHCAAVAALWLLLLDRIIFAQHESVREPSTPCCMPACNHALTNHRDDASVALCDCLMTLPLRDRLGVKQGLILIAARKSHFRFEFHSMSNAGSRLTRRCVEYPLTCCLSKCGSITKERAHDDEQPETQRLISTHDHIHRRRCRPFGVCPFAPVRNGSRRPTLALHQSNR